jgi:hypothetical protein
MFDGISARYAIGGDKHLIELRKFRKMEIVSARSSSLERSRTSLTFLFSDHI